MSTPFSFSSIGNVLIVVSCEASIAREKDLGAGSGYGLEGAKPVVSRGQYSIRGLGHNGCTDARIKVFKLEP